MNAISLFILIVCLCHLSCNKDTLPKYSLLDRLRILGIVSNTPEIQNPSAGITNVSINPFISDIGGSGDILLEIQSCLDPGVGLGAEADCSQGLYASSIQNITVSSTATAVEGLFGEPERTGSPQSGSITVPLQIPPSLLDQFSSNLQYNGISYIITLKATSSTNSIRSFRRILISTKTPNTNPSLSNLLINNSDYSQRPPDGTFQLSFNSADTPENYSFLAGDGEYRSLQEEYETSWFVSEGLIESSRSKITEFIEWKLTSSNPAPPRKLVMVGVLRDDRGGTDIKVKTFSP